MSPILDLAAIAERIARLIAERDAGGIAAKAVLLGVNTGALRRSIDRQSPRPSLSVVVALVRHYGVDPAWLLYGDYDTATHALAADKGDTITPGDLLMLIESPRFVKGDEPFEQRPRAQLDS
jgi:hypothetical protein